MAAYGQRFVTASGQILMAAHTAASGGKVRRVAAVAPYVPIGAPGATPVLTELHSATFGALQRGRNAGGNADCQASGASANC